MSKQKKERERGREKNLFKEEKLITQHAGPLRIIKLCDVIC